MPMSTWKKHPLLSFLHVAYAALYTLAYLCYLDVRSKIAHSEALPAIKFGIAITSILLLLSSATMLALATVCGRIARSYMSLAKQKKKLLVIEKIDTYIMVGSAGVSAMIVMVAVLFLRGLTSDTLSMFIHHMLLAESYTFLLILVQLVWLSALLAYFIAADVGRIGILGTILWIIGIFSYFSLAVIVLIPMGALLVSVGMRRQAKYLQEVRNTN